MRRLDGVTDFRLFSIKKKTFFLGGGLPLKISLFSSSSIGWPVNAALCKMGSTGVSE